MNLPDWLIFILAYAKEIIYIVCGALLVLLGCVAFANRQMSWRERQRRRNERP